MSTIDVIPITEQVYLLNKQLIEKADTFEDAVITVGGQAVQYWISYYYQLYGDSLPVSELVTSIDVDYSAKKSDIAAIAHALNLEMNLNDDVHPPSLAKFLLIDKVTKIIKEVEGRFFAEPDTDTPNTIDIIDRPAGFEYSDFDGVMLYFNTELFSVGDPNTGLFMEHEEVRVLNPIACMKSRFKNLTALHRPTEIEVARINALMAPVYYFLIQKFEIVDTVSDDQRRATFSEARQYLRLFYYLAFNRSNMRVQVQYEIKLYKIFESLMNFFSKHQDDYNFDKLFWSHDLRCQHLKLLTKYNRLRNII